ncbi:ribokinase [Comamonas sp. 17RB]|uniref:ribokinase n=1 Tax=Comamonas sp. 17RB TaxID=3047025 RepID=UPI0024B65859|nr:ribokinase [Comamonas sp. 17RB]MDI9857357.1 ribokinase [Comamonas sp. 17RB]
MVAPLSSSALPRKLLSAQPEPDHPHSVARIAVVGSLHMDAVLHLERVPRAGETVMAHSLRYLPGGKGGNQAVACARHGAQVTLFGCVGRDHHGNSLRLALHDAGVDMDHVQVLDGVSTGAAMVLVEGNGQNRICVVPGANVLLELPDEALLNVLAQADFVLLQRETSDSVLEQVLEAARSAGCRVVFNPSPVRELPEAWWPLVHTLVVNEVEAAAYSDQVVDSPATAADGAQRLLARGVSQVVVTLGAQGAVAVCGGRVSTHPALALPVLDTTGAGDSFLGALVTRLAEGHALGDAVQWGIRAASLCMGQVGAQASIPQRAQVEALAGGVASPLHVQ